MTPCGTSTIHPARGKCSAVGKGLQSSDILWIAPSLWVSTFFSFVATSFTSSLKNTTAQALESPGQKTSTNSATE